MLQIYRRNLLVSVREQNDDFDCQSLRRLWDVDENRVFKQIQKEQRYNIVMVCNNIMEKQFECVKIKDGLYLGNKIVAFDLEFLLINKFAFIVNCAAEVPNLFEEHGIRYLKFKIKQEKNQHIFDEELKRLKKIKKIIAEAEETGLCCLIHCNQSGNRGLVLLTAYLMDRFRWRLRKTIEFLQSKGVSIVLSDSNIEQLTNLEYVLSRQNKLSHLWIGPFIDEEEELLTKTYNNTAKQQGMKQVKPTSPINKQILKEQGINERSQKRIQWQDKLQKQQKRQKRRQLAERIKDQRRQMMQRSKQKLLEEQQVKKDSKTHKMIMPKDKSQPNKRSKKKIAIQPEVQGNRKIEEETELITLLKKTGKINKQLILSGDEAEKIERESNEVTSKAEEESEQKVQMKQKEEDKKIYKLTINNYINPNINIIKPPLDKKKKVKPAPKKEKDKFNRTFSEKEAFKKIVFLDKELPKGKDTSTDKRNSGHTPMRMRKERKSQKQKN